jgi:hypothetical protein
VAKSVVGYRAWLVRREWSVSHARKDNPIIAVLSPQLSTGLAFGGHWKSDILRASLVRFIASEYQIRFWDAETSPELSCGTFSFDEVLRAECTSATIPSAVKAPANTQHQSNPDTVKAIATLKLAATSITAPATSSWGLKRCLFEMVTYLSVKRSTRSASADLDLLVSGNNERSSASCLMRDSRKFQPAMVETTATNPPAIVTPAPTIATTFT